MKLTIHSQGDRERERFFTARRVELRGMRWRDRVRSAKIISHCMCKASEAREGGWCIERPADRDLYGSGPENN